ncbi:nucleotide exchange factor GrpE [Streptomyces sp. BA2]|uniref:nucleotide exchange factor GrpE n=1 Tax=Streptomyces sp. BA2 TaxID=436595 RepID=UPI001321DE8F|nr:nucleotide exchange factor GrpE [Streptomyces sp. BA2]MWA14318.1 nucleotide exchange factor GrpE [Streptomyces sp. BA2]
MSTQDPSPATTATAARLAYENSLALAARDAAHRALTEQLLLVLADALDSFDRLLAEGKTATPDSYRRSLELISRQLETAMMGQGVEPVGRVGERADPATHHVAEVRAAPPGAADDEVLEILQRGYRYRGRVLRAARVVVAVTGGPEQGTERS